MKKYLFGVAFIILCVTCAVWIKKGCASEVAMNVITSTTNAQQKISHSNQLLQLSNMSNTVVVSNGVIVVDTREKIPFADPGYNDYLLELRDAAEKGANSKFTLHVTDQDGKEVSDAEVEVLFTFNGRKGNSLSGKTDIHGRFPVEDRTTGEPSFTVSKKGFYRTSSKFGVLKIGTRCLQNGRWLPWDPTLEVTLKEIRNPIPMIVKKAKIVLPKKGSYFEYDFLVGDLVEPHGSGKRGDMAFMYKSERSRSSHYLDFTKELWIKAMAEGEGLILKKKDGWSTLNSSHEAPDSGYLTNLMLRTDRTDTKILENIEINEDDYLIIRSRVEKNSSGEIVSSKYGKFYGRIDYGSYDKNPDIGAVNILYYFNPTPNDRNLEFDGKNNLLKEQSSRERRTYAP
jgi:hypothetical protein